MKKLIETAAPEGRFITPFASLEAHYTDAFHMDVDARVALPDFIAAFYTTPLFRAERFVLRLTARAPSTDADVQALAKGASERFAAWVVEERSETEILLGDVSGRTKSWLCAMPQGDGTRLWFGSVVVPVLHKGKLTLGPVFHSLLGAHKVYSRLLLSSAAARITARAASGRSL